MIFSEWLDKYRVKIGIVLLVIIAVGIIFLLWGERIFKKNDNGQEKYIANLESRLSELETKINSQNSGQVAGIAEVNTETKEDSQESKEENQETLININTASAEELDQLPGIGPTRAQYIIEYREANGGFQTEAEIQNIKGIGPATYEKMKEMITIE